MADSPHWQPALAVLDDTDGGLYGPRSFRDYLRANEFDPRNFRTAAEISIDTQSDLADPLRATDTMVLRLGSAPDGTGTQFALCQIDGQLQQFFIDEADFDSPEPYELDLQAQGGDIHQFDQQTQEMLSAYQLLPRFSESSLVNLALSTGVVSRALGLDVERIGTAPVTVNSTFEFEFQPHPAIRASLHHNNGQVEVDTCFVTRRNGKRVAVVLEAKTGAARSLAKHKLFYPSLGIRSEAEGIVEEIIPVYCRAQRSDEAIRYATYECSPIAVAAGTPTLTDVEVSSHSKHRLQI